MTLNVLQELQKYGRGRVLKAPPVPVVLSALGQIGHVEHRRGLYLNPATEHHVRALLRDHYRAERAARELSGGRLGADDLLPVAALGTDSRDAIRVIKSMRAAIATWDDVVNARATGKSWDFTGSKASQTTVTVQWSSFLRTAGNPQAMTITNIPGGAALNSASAGAWPLPMTLGGAEHLFLTNFGQNHPTGTNITLVADVLVNAGNILTTVTTSQNVSSTGLPRWTNGEGIEMTLEVTTALGATAANVTVNYTDQAGTAANSTGAIAMTTSAIAARLQPVQDGPSIRFAAGDYGVRSVQTITCSASMAAGVVCLLLYKPLLLMPTIATTTFVERTTPAQIGGIRKLTETAGGSKPFIGFLVLTSTTSTGVQIYLIETIWG